LINNGRRTALEEYSDRHLNSAEDTRKTESTNIQWIRSLKFFVLPQ